MIDDTSSEEKDLSVNTGKTLPDTSYSFVLAFSLTLSDFVDHFEVFNRRFTNLKPEMIVQVEHILGFQFSPESQSVSRDMLQ